MFGKVNQKWLTLGIQPENGGIFHTAASMTESGKKGSAASHLPQTQQSSKSESTPIKKSSSVSGNAIIQGDRFVGVRSVHFVLSEQRNHTQVRPEMTTSRPE